MRKKYAVELRHVVVKQVIVMADDEAEAIASVRELGLHQVGPYLVTDEGIHGITAREADEKAELIIW